MGLVHVLPGTTFSNVGQRGSYDSDKAACLTLDELERWLAVAVDKYYHLRPHEGLVCASARSVAVITHSPLRRGGIADSVRACRATSWNV